MFTCVKCVCLVFFIRNEKLAQPIKAVTPFHATKTEGRKGKKGERKKSGRKEKREGTKEERKKMKRKREKKGRREAGGKEENTIFRL